MQSLLAGRLTGRLNDGAARFEPMRVNARESVNRSYNALPNTITERLAQRGYGRSGTLGNALTQVETSRAGSLSDVEGTIQKMIAGDEDQTLQMMQQLLNSGRGISTTGTNVLPGSAAGGAFGGGIETLMAMLINKDKLGSLFGG